MLYIKTVCLKKIFEKTCKCEWYKRTMILLFKVWADLKPQKKGILEIQIDQKNVSMVISPLDLKETSS